MKCVHCDNEAIVDARECSVCWNARVARHAEQQPEREDEVFVNWSQPLGAMLRELHDLREWRNAVCDELGVVALRDESALDAIRRLAREELARRGES